MPKRLIILIVLIAIINLIHPAQVFASRTINSATLNGSSSVTVTPSSSITAVVNVTTVADGSGAVWGSTQWSVNSVNTCVDHANHTTAGTYSETFTITAPASAGTYDVTFTAFVTNACGTGAASYTLTGGIIVATPTPTPTNTPVPTLPPGVTTTPNPNTTVTPTTSSGSQSGNSTSPSTTYYPTLTLRRSNLTFTGTASVENGTISSVEYSLDSGISWINAAPQDGNFNAKSENYVFTPKVSLSVGSHKVLSRAKSQAQVYTLSENYASVEFVVEPPKVKLDEFSPNPTNDLTPTITGSTNSAFSSISRTEISIDDGHSWLRASGNGGRFSITLDKLEDGNYPIRARAFDLAGNVGESDTKILVVDTIPPVIGGNMISIGSQVLTSDENGIIRTVAGTEIMLTASMKGGVTEAKIISGDKEFTLEQIPGTSLWTAKLNYETAGKYLLKLFSKDGAENQTERELNYVFVEEAGRVYRKESDDTPVQSQIKAYFYDQVSKMWVLWDGRSFGQVNPQTSSENGSYSFLVPPGKYYLEVSAPGFKTVRSQILELDDSTILNSNFPLSAKPTLRLNLPFFGEIVFSLPSLTPTETIIVNSKPQQQSQLTSKMQLGLTAPGLSLTSNDGNLVNTSGLKKKYVLTFLSTWSIQSLEQIPLLSEAQKRLDDKTIIGVFLQESKGVVSTFMRRGGYTFTALADVSGESTNKFPVMTLPQHFFVDSQGKLQKIFTGVLTSEEIINTLNGLE